MIDSRFSSQAFAEAEIDSENARELADQLNADITRELTEFLSKKVEIIVAELNALGHNLQLNGGPRDGAISYRDDFSLGSRYVCRLRIAVDIDVSTGYAHLINANAENF